MNTRLFARFPEPLRRELLIIGPLAGGFALLLGTVLIGAPNAVDREFTRTTQGLGLHFLPWLGSEIGGGVYGTVIAPALAGTWFVATRRWKLLILLGAAFALHYVMISPKLFITAYRPSPVFGVDGGGGLESFPSGHVQWAVSFYGLLAYLLLSNATTTWHRIAILGMFALVVVGTMFGRIDLGRHWLTDTVAGVLVGLIALRIMVHLHRWPALDRLASRLIRLLPGRRLGADATIST